MKWISTIKEIGTSAISEKDRTVICLVKPLMTN